MTTLNAGRLQAWRDHGPLTLRCQTGALWVTQAGVAADFVLEAGQSLTLPPNAHTVVKALAGARFELECWEGCGAA